MEIQPPPAEPRDDELPPFVMDSDFDIALAIIDHRPLPRPLDRLARDHVKNHVYKVRWRGKRHTEDSWEAYEAVWHQFAFEDFISGSHLIGHVAPSAYSRAHRQHVNALLRNQVPDRDVPLVNPHAIDNDLRDYVILEHRAPANSRLLQASQRQHAEEHEHIAQSKSHRVQLNLLQANNSDIVLPSQQPQLPDGNQLSLSGPSQASIPANQQQDIGQPQLEQDSTIADSASSSHRRSTRERRQSSFGDDFVSS